jgi:hypothetical protein
MKFPKTELVLRSQSQQQHYLVNIPQNKGTNELGIIVTGRSNLE